MMLHTIRTTSNNPDFQKLSALFDDYLVAIDGDEKDFFAQYNQIYLDNVIVCYDDDAVVGCCAFKQNSKNIAEIKRMFIHPDQRGKGIANTILTQIEVWAAELDFTTCILETSVKLKAAIALYQKFGYFEIPRYGQYIGVESSYCMKKELK
jgi:GNAT superfamily N-acetyltransferase